MTLHRPPRLGAAMGWHCGAASGTEHRCCFREHPPPPPPIRSRDEASQVWCASPKFGFCGTIQPIQPAIVRNMPSWPRSLANVSHS
jgi:hypothetical protein